MKLEVKRVEERILDKCDNEIKELIANGIHPYQRIIRVDGDSASENYVNRKTKKFKEKNIGSDVVLLPNDVTMDRLLEEIKKANEDIKVTGVMLQLPLPKHLDEKIAINAIDPNKDSDCLTSFNLGKMFEGDHELAPCTPKGIMSILKYYNVELKGKKVLIINRSILVGKPLIELMLGQDATVTIAHSKTEDLYKEIFSSDIIITAVGKKSFFTKTMLNTLNQVSVMKDKNVYIIDVSINRTEDNKLCGDVTKNIDINSLSNIFITPVPGGVGLTTVATLLENCILCTKRQFNIK